MADCVEKKEKPNGERNLQPQKGLVPDKYRYENYAFPLQESVSIAPKKHRKETEEVPQKTVSLCVMTFLSKFCTSYLKKRSPGGLL